MSVYCSGCSLPFSGCGGMQTTVERHHIDVGEATIQIFVPGSRAVFSDYGDVCTARREPCISGSGSLDYLRQYRLLSDIFSDRY